MTAPSPTFSGQRLRGIRSRLLGFVPEAFVALTCIDFIAEHLDRPASLTKTIGIWSSVVGLICLGASVTLQIRSRQSRTR